MKGKIVDVHPVALMLQKKKKKKEKDTGKKKRKERLLAQKADSEWETDRTMEDLKREYHE